MSGYASCRNDDDRPEAAVANISVEYDSYRSSGLLRETLPREDELERLDDEDERVLEELDELDPEDRAELDELGRVALRVRDDEEELLDRSRLTEELRPDEDRSRDTLELRSGELLGSLVVDGRRVVELRSGVTVLVRPDVLDRSALESRGTSLAPPIESITLPGTGVSLHSRLTEEPRSSPEDGSGELRSRPRSLQFVSSPPEDGVRSDDGRVTVRPLSPRDG